jgi:hypothetical protein
LATLPLNNKRITFFDEIPSEFACPCRPNLSPRSGACRWGRYFRSGLLEPYLRPLLDALEAEGVVATIEAAPEANAAEADRALFTLFVASRAADYAWHDYINRE